MYSDGRRAHDLRPRPAPGEGRASVTGARGSGAVVLYCGLAYAITWLAVSPLVAQALGLGAGPRVPAWWHALGAAGPVGAAFITARAAGGREVFRSWTGALTRVRIPVRWWVIGVGSPLVLWAIGVLTAGVVTGQWSAAELLEGAVSEPSWWLGVGLVSLAYGLGEEPGWRGYLLPRLLERYSPRLATLLLATVWAGWHLPFFTYRYDFEGPVTFIGFFIALLAGAYWLTFLYRRTGGSVPAVAVWHLMWNVVNFVGAEMSDLVVGAMNGAMMVLGFGVAWVGLPGHGASRQADIFSDAGEM